MKTKSSTLDSTKEFVHTIIKKLDRHSTYYNTSNNKKQKLIVPATTATATATATVRTVQRLIVGYDEDSDDYDDYFSSISNRSSGRQQDENKLHTTRSNRHVSFHEVVQVHPIISALELLLSADEIIIYSGDDENDEKKNEYEINNEVKQQLLWYTQNDYDSIKRKNHTFIQDIKDGVLICNTTPQQYTIRGLEHHLSSDINFVHKFITIRHSVVLKEQEKQKQRSHHLATRYKIRNERNIKDAIQRGIMDHQEAISSN